MGEIELFEEYAVIALPEDAVEVEIKAKLYKDGEIVEVGKTMNMQELRMAFQEAKDWYIPSDAVFSLTDKGRAMLDGRVDNGR